MLTRGNVRQVKTWVGALVVLYGMAVCVHASPAKFSRDPFQPIGTMSSQSGYMSAEDDIETIRLTGIVWDDSHPAAVIQAGRLKHVLYTGDALDALKLHTVHPKKIEISVHGEIFMLDLGEELSLP